MADNAPASADLLATLTRIASALERLAPPAPRALDLDAADAFVWHSNSGSLQPVAKVNRVDMELLHGIERVRDPVSYTHLDVYKRQGETQHGSDFHS